MGVKVSIPSSNGIFPAIAPDATLSPDEVFEQSFAGNHPSFRDAAPGSHDLPGLDVVTEHLNKGFGLLFADRAAAERHLRSPIALALLGCISKVRGDGTSKHRVVMDLRRNRVNDAAVVTERQVLPTVFHHAADLARLSNATLLPESSVKTLVLDFADAFMGISLPQGGAAL